MKQLIIGLNDDDDKCCRAKFDKVSQHVIQVTHSVNEELIINNINCQEKADENSDVSPRLDDSIRENVMEGYNEERKNMVERLTKSSGANKLQVVSVVGMAGIGKTTFTKTILFDNYIKRIFHIRGWITVSNNYDLKKLLQLLLHDVIKMEGKNYAEMDIGQLASHVKLGLQGQRYLIVVDDIWSNQDWDTISHWFPDCGNKSRILLTSRDNKVGEYAATNPKDGLVLMRPLTQDESRNLFYHRAFGENYSIRGSNIDEFEKVGEKVITNCKGLPLMITAVAGILCSKSKLDEWMEVAKSVSSLVNDDAYKQCLKVVALSYDNLPSLMKACFLHFGVFPRAHVISVKKLIRLWIAEGLINLKGVDEFEQVGARVLHDLIGKSVVIVDKRGLNGKIKTCRIHDIFHDFCLKEGESQNLLHVVGSDSTTNTVISQLYNDSRWISIQSENRIILNSRIEARSLYNINNNTYFSKEVFLFKLLRVLNLEDHYTQRLSIVTRDLVCLRYLSVLTRETCMDLSITNLWNLQTLILTVRPPYLVHRVVTFPEEIWQMTQLRHLYARGISLSSPGEKVLGNLQRVFGLSPSCCTKEIFEGIKKVKKLTIRETKQEYPTDVKWIDNLKYLQDLESLSIETKEMLITMDNPRSFSFTSPYYFPQKLKKLKLNNTYLPWKYMSVISKLPELEVLKLKRDSFRGHEWKATQQTGFPKLRFLLLAKINLNKWKTTIGSHDHFPSLERVNITDCKYLKKIPKGFADSKKLEMIELHKCDRSLVTFVKKIQKKHEYLGRNKLKVIAFGTESLEEQWNRLMKK
ncbi:hypothetical protein EJD97_014554 [Solanum chilense]|uniref:Uncharacterized protein n=1 Tax=Solanum chilense TaxID=4083 RepID=A0A6N2BDK9_SOLCI|nr:hypothetical protein EJD97_014554 [Solanum chilense]